MSEKTKVGLVQMSCSPKPDENLAKAVSRVEEAAAKGALEAGAKEAALRPLLARSYAM